MQNQAHATLFASTLSANFSDFEESARYSLLQRLVPAIRHHLMGEFQSVGVLAAMMDRRLQAATPHLVSLREDSLSLGNVSTKAASSSVNLMTWIAPDKSATLKVDAGVNECLGLLSTELRLKGFVIVNEVHDCDAEIFSTALRSVLTAALIALSDLSEAAADVVLRVQSLPDRVELTIDLRPNPARTKGVRPTPSRLLGWRDVEILALAENVKLTRAQGVVQLDFPRRLANMPRGNSNCSHIMGVSS